MGQMPGVYKPGEELSGFAAAQVTGGRFVKVSADKHADGAYTIAHCGLGERAFGVAQHDSLAPTYDTHAQGRLVNVVRRGAIARVTAGANLTAGQEVMSDSLGRAVPAAGAALVTGTVGANNAIAWAAKGAGGDNVTIALVDPPGNNVALSVDVDGDAITVTLATDGSSVVTSTAADVIAAIAEHDTASQKVTAANSGASTGAGLVAAVAATPLAGGGTKGVVLGVACANATSGGTAEIDLI